MPEKIEVMPDYAKGETMTPQEHVEMVTGSQAKLKESIKSRHGFDCDQINWRDPQVFGKLTAMASDMGWDSLQEADATGGLAQVTRYGVQEFAIQAYKQYSVVYEKIVSLRPSKGRADYYAPFYIPDEPLDIAEGSAFKESKTTGLASELINKKVGRIIAFNTELFEDDQTGQVAQRAGLLGKRMRTKEERDVMSAIFVTGAYTTTIGNKTSGGYGVMTQTRIEQLHQALISITDPSGSEMLVTPDTLLYGTDYVMAAPKLINSTYQPSYPDTTTGATGYFETVNPLKGAYELVMSRFTNKANWVLMEAKTMIPFQERKALEMLMEAPNAGVSFEKDQVRHRVRRRYQVAVLDYRWIGGGYVA